MPSWWQILFGGRKSKTAAERSIERRANPRRPVTVNGRLEWRDQDHGLHSCSARILELSDGGILVECDYNFTPSHVVEIADSKGDLMRFVVRHSNPVAPGRFRVGMMELPTERRREIREPAGGQPALRWVANSGKPERADVGVVNVSDSGIRVQSPVAIDVGARVTIEGDSIRGHAMVRYCNPENDRFSIGLQLMDSTLRLKDEFDS